MRVDTVETSVTRTVRLAIDEQRVDLDDLVKLGGVTRFRSRTVTLVYPDEELTSVTVCGPRRLRSGKVTSNSTSTYHRDDFARLPDWLANLADHHHPCPTKSQYTVIGLINEHTDDLLVAGVFHPPVFCSRPAICGSDEGILP